MSNKKKSRQEREASSRSRGAELMQQQRAKEKRRNAMIQGGLLVTVVAVVILLVVVVLQYRDRQSEPATAPAGVSDDGGFVVGAEDASVTVAVVEDLQCPVCREFELANGQKLQELSQADDTAVEYRVVSFLDRASTDDYSSRAANATACVWDEGDPEVWRSFHDSLYAQQPAEGGAGLSDDQLVQLATTAGADESSVRPCVEDGGFRRWVEQNTDAISDSGVSGTPTVFVNGEETDARTPEELQAAVDEARA